MEQIIHYLRSKLAASEQEKSVLQQQVAELQQQLAACRAACVDLEVELALRLCHKEKGDRTPPPPSTPPTPSTPPPPPAQQPLQAQLMVIVQNEEDKRM